MIFRGKIYKILSAMAIAMVVTGCSYVEDRAILARSRIWGVTATSISIS